MADTGQFLLLLNLVILHVNSNHSSKPADVPLRVSISSVTGNSNSSFCCLAGLSVNDRSTANFKFKSRAKRFLSCRVQYTAKGMSSFHLERDLLACDDVSVNPGPRKLKTAPKYPCNECKGLSGIIKTPFCAQVATNGHMPNVYICHAQSFGTIWTSLTLSGPVLLVPCRH